MELEVELELRDHTRGETLHIRGDTLGAEKGICGLMFPA